MIQIAKRSRSIATEKIDGLRGKLKSLMLIDEMLYKTKKEMKAKIVQRLGDHKFARSNRFHVRHTVTEVAESTSTRKAHKRSTLKFDDDPVDAQDAPAPADLQAGMDAQAPLDKGKKK